MFLYGGEWCVNIPRDTDGIVLNNEVIEGSLELSAAGCSPGYCQVIVKQNKLKTGAVVLHRNKMKITNIEHYCARHIAEDIHNIYHTISARLTRWHMLDMSWMTLPICGVPLLIIPQLNFDRWPILSEEHRVQRKETTYLSPDMFFRDFIDQAHGYKLLGPAFGIADFDLVPGLFCSRPFPCIKQFLTRTRRGKWPTPEALRKISIIPGMIVPKGSKGTHDTEWRFSFSLQELCLSQEMPAWTKSGYRLFKYTLKYFIGAYREILPPDSTPQNRMPCESDERTNRIIDTYVKYRNELQCVKIGLNQRTTANVTKEKDSHVCSFHLKTILLWSLENPDTWNQKCPFHLMRLLLLSLEGHLLSRSLPHYFVPDCDLMKTVSGHELSFTRSCVAEILRDLHGATYLAFIKPTSQECSDELMSCWCNALKVYVAIACLLKLA